MQNDCARQVAEELSQSTSSTIQGGDRRIVSWLFLIGSLIFTCDSVLESMEGVSLHSLFHLLASVLFTIGSVLFIPNGQQQ